MNQGFFNLKTVLKDNEDTVLGIDGFQEIVSKIRPVK